VTETAARVRIGASGIYWFGRPDETEMGFIRGLRGQVPLERIEGGSGEWAGQSRPPIQGAPNTRSG